ncbi:methyltransferase domain-containing protein [Methylomonas sp. OY6]|uniref:Methyltransferase domain-containing protein n=1 Tax=Methylomonas defluvii TaxID=3045149 RepID=A0ABU4UG47_9GAMM|nr:methyltransferase domain-containing protein [Methylomonas sp. OY6]MDX8128461.1 methyltransferase domain-containing protein [Methylomonas sp. OY6]
MYQCIACRGNLIDESPSIKICSHCGTSYPIINGISFFLLPDPFSSLQGFVMEMEEAKAALTKINQSLEDFERCSDTGTFERRIRTIKEGIDGNIRVLEKSCQPIMDFLQNRTRQDNALAWSSVKSGFTFHDMLPYFYQDWFGTPDFSEVRKLFAKTLDEHCKDRESVAVLGAGACGLLYNISDNFQVSYGVDLSLPTLLSAKMLIEGEALTFHLQTADWHYIELASPKPTENDIRYIVSDVMNMPFESASLSVVITQYMLDIASNPKRLSEEIFRVLKPDGMWINFSNPFRVLGDPVELGWRKLNELPDFFKKMGFEPVSMEIEHFTLLNVEKICNETGNTKQLVHFLTLRKSQDIPDFSKNEKSIQRFFKQNDNIWHEIPEIVKGRELDFVRRRSFDELGRVRESLEISLAGHFFSIPSNFAMLLETIFECINGNNSLREIFAVLQQNNIGLSEVEFLQLIYTLNIQHYLIKL